MISELHRHFWMAGNHSKPFGFLPASRSPVKIPCAKLKGAMGWSLVVYFAQFVSKHSMGDWTKANELGLTMKYCSNMGKLAISKIHQIPSVWWMKNKGTPIWFHDICIGVVATPSVLDFFFAIKQLPDRRHSWKARVLTWRSWPSLWQVCSWSWPSCFQVPRPIW